MLAVLLKASLLGPACGLVYGYGVFVTGLYPLASAGFGAVVISIKDSK